MKRLNLDQAILTTAVLFGVNRMWRPNSTTPEMDQNNRPLNYGELIGVGVKDGAKVLGFITFFRTQGTLEL